MFRSEKVRSAIISLAALLLAASMLLSASCARTTGEIGIDPAAAATDIHTAPGDPSPDEPTGLPEAQNTELATDMITPAPTDVPASGPAGLPSAVPTELITDAPTEEPTPEPSPEPTVIPTAVLTATPAPKPSVSPTAGPTATPTSKPTATPTSKPTATPQPGSSPRFIFNTWDSVYGGILSSVRNNINSVAFDTDRKCAVISVGAVSDPWIMLSLEDAAVSDSELTVDAEIYKYMQLGVKIDPKAGTEGQFYFQTGKNRNLDEPKHVDFNYKNTDSRQYVTVNLGSNTYWSGTVLDSRIDPFTNSKAACDYELYYIAFFRSQAAADAFGEKWLSESSSSGPGSDATPTPAPEGAYSNTAPFVNSYTVGIDDLGRTLTAGSSANTERTDRQVGIFYFLWIGYHSASLYDNSSIIAKNPDAIKSESSWIASGGGGVSAFHFWGKPMFGYYPSSEEWVMRKHVQMLTDAGIDFLCFDATNAYTYTANALGLMNILKTYQDQGFDVPKVCFYTNSSSGATMNAIYKDIYKARPDLQSLWYYWDGQPMIVGSPTDSALSAEVKSFFRIKRSVWPNSGRHDDGFPWMEFSRLMTSGAVYGQNGRKEVVNVSVAQHNSTVTFSYTAWYGGNDRSRSWHSGKNDTSPDAYLYGYNFGEQFEWAIAQDPEMIFITGWNEWIAQRQSVADSSRPIRFVDNADPNCSRDIEPMEGGYGDNYYLQMISYIRRYKGAAGKTGRDVRTIDIDGRFSQWNDVTAYYKDYTQDTVKRSNSTFEKKTDNTNRNDISELKVCEDSENVYFFVNTAGDITDPSANDFSATGWMTLYISTDLSSGWKGFNYVVNYLAPADGKTAVGRLAYSDSYSVSKCGEARIRVDGSCMMIAVPKSALGISGNANFSFKWADNNSWGDVFSFYKNGDAAPIGRVMYVYGD